MLAIIPLKHSKTQGLLQKKRHFHDFCAIIPGFRRKTKGVLQTGDIHETVKRLLAVNLYRLVCHELRSLTEECIKVVTKLRKPGTSITTSDLQFWREFAGTDLAKIAIETERTGTPLATFPSSENYAVGQCSTSSVSK